MTPPTDVARFSAGVVCVMLTICAVGWPTYTHAQPPVPVQDVEQLGPLTKLVVTLRALLARGALEQVHPLYAYNPQEIAGAEVHPETLGDVATVSRCQSNTEEGAWCARYFADINGAFNAAYRANDANLDVYFATTYPLPNIEPERRFVSGLSP